MEALIGLSLLVVLIGAILGIFAFRRTQRLQTQVLELRDAIAVLQQGREPAGAKTSAVPSVRAALSEVAQKAKTDAEEPADTLPAASCKPDAPVHSTPQIQSAPAPTPPPKKRGFVDELGARWSVWVGGLALGLGALFLLRYSIEAGVFSPALRVGLTVVLGLAALCAGEWLGRSDPAERSEALQNAYIPGVLTAVGILALFGSVYASYALYDFLGPASAFGLLGFLSLVGLALGLRQGPALSGLGLAGSLITPWLVSTSEPSYTGLYVYLLIVAAGALLLARYRAWAWLSCAAAAGGLAWALIGFDLHLETEFWPWSLYLAGLTGLTLVVNGAQRLPFGANEPGKLLGKTLPLLTFGSTGLLFLMMLSADLFSLRAFYMCLAVAAFGLAAAWHWGRLSANALLAGALATAAVLARGSEVVGGNWDWPVGGIYIPSPIEGEWARVFIVALVTSAALIGASAFSAKTHLRSQTRAPLFWSLTGAAYPVLMIGLLWLIGAKGVTHLPFALASVGLAAAFAGVTEWFYRGESSEAEEPSSPLPMNVFAAGGCFALLLAYIAGLSGLPLMLALTATLPALAALTTVRSIWVLRVAVPVIGGVLALHILYSLGAVHNAVGPRIIFNALWIYLALPAAMAGLASWLLARTTADKWSQAAEALALAFAALFAVFQVRHYMNAGDLFAPVLTLEELSLQILVSLCFSLGLSRIKDVGPRSLFSIAAMGAMGLSLASLVFGNLISFNPFFNAAVDVRGGSVFNSLLLAYLLPGLFLGAIAWLQQHKRPDWYLKMLGGVSLAALIAYVTTMVRFGFHGEEAMALALTDIENTEQYTYSIVWLLFGIAFLTGGMIFKVRELRIGSAAVMVLTVAKVFLIDMSALEGILRALSFVGLGAVLIGMGLVYQRVLARDEEAPGEQGEAA